MSLTDHERAIARVVAARTHLPDGGLELAAEVAEMFIIDPLDILGESRAAHVVDARAILAIALSDRGWTTVQIAAFLNRTQSTAHHMLQRFKNDFELRSLAKQVAA